MLSALLNRKKLRLAAGALAAAAAVFLLGWLASGMPVPTSGTESLAYVTSGGQLMYLPGLEGEAPALVGENVNAGAGAQFSPDGKTLYYLDGSQSLYKVNLPALSRGGRPERIAVNAAWVHVLDNGAALYGKNVDSRLELHCHSGKEDFSIAKSYGGYQLSEDQRTIYYAEESIDGENYLYTLYKMPLRQGARPELLVENACGIYSDYTASTLVYGQLSQEGGEGLDNQVTVYLSSPGGEPVRLPEPICQYPGPFNVSVNGGAVSFYYTVEGWSAGGNRCLNLYRYAGGKSVLAAGEIDPETWTVDFDAGACVYRKADGRPAWYQCVDGVENTLDLGEDTACVLHFFVLEGGWAVLDLYRDNESCLDLYRRTEAGFTFSSRAAQGDYACPQRGGGPRDKDCLYYYTNVDNTDFTPSGNLVRWRDGAAETVARGINEVLISEDGTTYAIHSPAFGDWSLSLIREGTPYLISGELSQLMRYPIVLDGQRLLYLGGGGLWLWDGKENRQIAQDAERVWSNNQKADSVYPLWM